MSGERFVSDAFDQRIILRFEGGPLHSVDMIVEFSRVSGRSLDATAYVGWEEGFGANADEYEQRPGYEGHYELARDQAADAWRFRWRGSEPT